MSGVTWAVGTLLINVSADPTERGRMRRVTRISPPGTFGTNHRDGPTYHATVVRSLDLEPIVGGHTADIRLGSMSYPLEDWTALKEWLAADVRA